MVAFDAQALAALRQGLAHFRAQDYFAAHDDWEAVWQELSGRQRTFWQAMIQLVVGGYHYTNGNRRGCQGQWQKALDKCDGLLQQCTAPAPMAVVHLRDILCTVLLLLERGDNPLPPLEHFAQAVCSETWFSTDFS